MLITVFIILFISVVYFKSPYYISDQGRSLALKTAQSVLPDDADVSDEEVKTETGLGRETLHYTSYVCCGNTRSVDS